MKPTIKAIARQDLEPISQLYVAVFSSEPWNEHWEYDWAYERLNWIYQSQGFIGFVAIDNGQIIGAILGYFFPFKGEKGFKILEFFVAANYQKRGIGSKLLWELELKLKQNKCDFTTLLTSKNTAIESFYLKRNYKRDSKLVLLRRRI